MNTYFHIFISSCQGKFATERMALRKYLLANPLLGRFIADVYVFENAPASGKNPQSTYLNKEHTSDIYIVLLEKEYGNEDEDGNSPIEHEFNLTKELNLERWVFILDCNERHPKMQKLVVRVNAESKRKKLMDFDVLHDEVFASFIDFLDEQNLLELNDFESSVCHGAETDDISDERIRWYLDKVNEKHETSLKRTFTPVQTLTHLSLVHDKQLLNSAILLFEKEPQEFYRPSELKCSRYTGVDYGRPFIDSKTLDGDLFSLVDQGVVFVLGHIRQTRGMRTDSMQAESEYEIPPDAIKEAIVNAVVHRNYHNKASVEIRIMCDRIEIRNPGKLPEDITLEMLYETHPSIPANYHLADVFKRVRYIEKFGTGILAIIELCREAGLPRPIFEERGNFFITTIWRDQWTNEALGKLKLNERQRLAIRHLKTHGRITSSEYMVMANVGKSTTVRELNGLIAQGVIVSQGDAAARHYLLATSDRANIVTIVPSVTPPQNGTKKVKNSMKILELLAKDRALSASLLTERIGLSVRAVEKQIAKLQANGKLIRIGSAKGGHWEVKG